LLQEIDAVLESIPKRRRPSRNEWIEQAIEEKIKRDQKRLGINVLTNTKLPPQKSEASQVDHGFGEDSLL
jgi:metal-responsive CopG/Arc/MetJ family transcriptional regulator